MCFDARSSLFELCKTIQQLFIALVAELIDSALPNMPALMEQDQVIFVSYLFEGMVPMASVFLLKQAILVVQGCINHGWKKLYYLISYLQFVKV